MGAGLFVIAIGIGTIVCGIFDIDWLFSGRKGKMLVHGLGRNGARIVYYILGAVIIGCEIFIITRS